MPLSQETIQYIVDQLSEFGEVEIKKMFGGCGIYKDGIMFALITAKSEFMLRVNAENKPDFIAKGAQPFNHEKKGRTMPYWEVPVDVVEDRAELEAWAKKAYAVAVMAKKK